MLLICKKETEIDEFGKKLMNFTKGLIYNFEEIADPKGWQTIDDKGKIEIFFNTTVMFEQLK